jgi:hypothetical protein
MRIFISAVLIFFLFGVLSASPENIPNKAIPPNQIEYDNVLLEYNKAWKDKEIYLEINLDNDNEKEILISFVSTYYPYTSNELKSDGEAESVKKQNEQLQPIENHAFYQIYDKGSQGDYKLVKTFSGMDQLGRIEIFSLAQGKPPAIAILNPCGANSTDLSIYQYQEGGYRMLFNETSSSEIRVETQENPIAIYIGTPESSGSVFVWNATKESFEQKTPA